MDHTLNNVRKIKLGYDLTWYPQNKTGVAFYVERLIKRIDEQYNSEIEIHLFVNEYSRKEFGGIKDISLHYVKGPLKLRYLYFHYYLSKIINRVNLDIIHFPFYGYYGKTNAKKIITVLDMYYMYDNKCLPNNRSTFYWINIFRRNLASADLVLAISENTKRDILRFAPGIMSDNIRVLFPIIDDKYLPLKDLSKKKEFMKKHNLYGPYLLSIGDSTVKRRNIEQLIKGFNMALEVGYTANLVLVGITDGDNVKALIDKYNIAKHVRLIGYFPEEELILLHQCAKYCIVPSLYEGFSYPVAQSIKCGIPVIISNNSCLGEVAGKAGIYIEKPFDSEKIKEVLLMSENEELYIELTEYCKKQSEEFNSNKLVTGYFNMYHTMVHKHYSQCR